ncbi:fasciclin domain-containing protein [Nocardioides panaciterrulae]|uniref:Putative surface protein with fasciclin (FAS1) repeats n=1 Tax=Nocardioides panaciterrulae TaxID=661492 RepID=A0A7Y9E3A4_9ACTN|nr:fasciclin domain-containing protein [Nocardioides panaciterrulae]NYD40160.1 putative surface protein with fasciclin (FAS1) repeats [Nocardioides panaciterrulae]
MKSNTLRRTGGLAALALTATMGLAACGNSDDTSASASDSTSMSSTPSDNSSSDSMASDAGAQTFGPGCSAIPTSGAGSFGGMATQPVATAASANPLLQTLVKAVGAAGLGDTLNSAQGITVFAPTDDAFGKIPSKTLDSVLKDKKTLTTILSHHVIGEQLSPDQLAGTHKTLAGDTVTVKGSGEDFTVGDENAKILCGNIPTANATVYVVDTVLMPNS